MPSLLFASIWFRNHIDTKIFFLGTKVLAWYLEPNGIENKTNVKYPCPPY